MLKLKQVLLEQKPLKISSLTSFLECKKLDISYSSKKPKNDLTQTTP